MFQQIRVEAPAAPRVVRYKYNAEIDDLIEVEPPCASGRRGPHAADAAVYEANTYSSIKAQLQADIEKSLLESGKFVTMDIALELAAPKVMNAAAQLACALVPSENATRRTHTQREFDDSRAWDEVPESVVAKCALAAIGDAKQCSEFRAIANSVRISWTERLHSVPGALEAEVRACLQLCKRMPQLRVRYREAYAVLDAHAEILEFAKQQGAM